MHGTTAFVGGLPLASHAGSLHLRRACPPRVVRAARRARASRPPPRACAGGDGAGGEDGPATRAELAAIGLGAACLPLLAYSEATLLATGCGLPAGPGGSVGAAEGVSYLYLVGVLAWSAWTKVRTGRGLRPGPYGALGAVEGFAFLLALGGVVAAGWTAYRFGGLPNAVPTEGGRCFPPQ